MTIALLLIGLYMVILGFVGVTRGTAATLLIRVPLIGAGFFIMYYVFQLWGFGK